MTNYQVAQQQVGPSFAYGMRFDDGKIVSLHSPQGQTTLQEHLTNLGVNTSANDTLTAAAGMNSQIAFQTARNFSRMKGEQLSQGMNELFSLSKSFAQQKGISDSFGESTLEHAQKSLSKALDTAKHFAKAHDISQDKAFTILLEAGMRAGGGLGKEGDNNGLLGTIGRLLSLGGGASGQLTSLGRNNEAVSQHLKSGIAQHFTESLNQGLQYLEDHKGSITDTFQKQKLDQLQGHVNKAEHYSEQEAVNLQQAHLWHQTASLMEQKSLSNSQAITADVLEYVADRKFGGDQKEAAAWQSQPQNRSAYLKAAEEFLRERHQGLTSFAESKGYEGQEKIKERHTSMSQTMGSTVNRSALEAMRQENPLALEEQILGKKQQALQEKTLKRIDTYEKKTGLTKQNIEKDLISFEQDFIKKNEEYLFTKAGKKLFNG